MKFPHPLTEKSIGSLWSALCKEDQKIQKQISASGVIAITGHIVFFIILSLIAFLLSCRSLSQTYYYVPHWVHNVSNFIAPVIPITISPILLYIISIIVVIIIPFILCVICKFICCFISFGPYEFIDLPNDTDKTIKVCIEKIDEFELAGENSNWDFHFLYMNGIEALLPFPFVMIPQLIVAFSISTNIHNADPIKYMLLYSVLISLPAILIWKLSAIINSLTYQFRLDCYDSVRDELRNFHNAYLTEQENKHSQLRKDLGSKIFRSAIAEDAVNYALLKKAADLGNPEACLMYGRYIIGKSQSDMLTKAEEQDALRLAAKYFYTGAQTGNTETELLYYICCIELKEAGHSNWQTILNRLRQLKSLNVIPEHLKTICNEKIMELIQYIESRL